MIDLGRYRAVTFDCYGTLIDWDRGLGEQLAPRFRAAGVTLDTPELLGRFADAQYRQQRLRPAKEYRQVVADAIAELATGLGVELSALDRATVVDSIGRWPPFADTLDALRALKARGLVLGVVSNVDAISFARTHRLLDDLLDVVVTADAVGAYKPDREMFEALLAACAERGIERGAILHAAQSRFHDIAPAAALGLDAVWVDRRAGRPGRGVTLPSDVEATVRVESLAALVALFDEQDGAPAP